LIDNKGYIHHGVTKWQVLLIWQFLGMGEDWKYRHCSVSEFIFSLVPVCDFTILDAQNNFAT